MLLILALCFTFAVSEQTAAQTVVKEIDELQIKETVFDLSRRVSQLWEILKLNPNEDLSGQEKTSVGFITGYMFASVADKQSLSDAESQFTNNFLDFANTPSRLWVH